MIQGFAPKSYEFEIEEGKKQIMQTAFYDEFIGNPIRGDELDRLSAPAKGAIELLVSYDNVLSQDIRVI